MFGLKREIAGIRSLKGVKTVVCGVRCIELTTEAIKILGVHFSYNQKIQMQKKILKRITYMQNISNLRRIINIALKEKIKIFKTLALSEIVNLSNINNRNLKTVN